MPLHVPAGIRSFTGLGADVPQPGVNYGPMVSVGGVGFIRSGYNVYSPHIGNPFLTTTDRDYAYPNPSNGQRCWMANPFARNGQTELEYISADSKWRPISNQVLIDLSNPDGSYLVSNPDQTGKTCSGMTSGTYYEVYTSPILPDWFFEAGSKFASYCCMGFKDTSSTANVTMAASISPIAITDSNNSLHGQYTPAANLYKGPSPGFVEFVVRNGKIEGGAANNQLTSNAQVFRSISTITPGAMRYRVSIAPGATTNTYIIGHILVVSR